MFLLGGKDCMVLMAMEMCQQLCWIFLNDEKDWVDFVQMFLQAGKWIGWLVLNYLEILLVVGH